MQKIFYWLHIKGYVKERKIIWRVQKKGRNQRGKAWNEAKNPPPPFSGSYSTLVDILERYWHREFTHSTRNLSFKSTLSTPYTHPTKVEEKCNFSSQANTINRNASLYFAFLIHLAFRILKPWLQGDFELKCPSRCFYWTLRNQDWWRAQIITISIRNNCTWTCSSSIFFRTVNVNFLLSFNTALLRQKYRNRDLQSRWDWVVSFFLQSFSFKGSL